MNYVSCCRHLMIASAAYDTRGETLNAHLILLEGREKVVILADKKNLTDLLRKPAKFTEGKQQFIICTTD